MVSNQMQLKTSWSMLTWCPESTITRNHNMVSQINYWIVFSEFRTTCVCRWGVLRLHKFSHITPALARLYWHHVSWQVAGWISKSHFWFIKAKMAPANVSRGISDLLKAYDPPGSCTQLASSCHRRSVNWNRMVIVPSSVHPQLYTKQYLSQCEDSQNPLTVSSRI